MNPMTLLQFAPTAISLLSNLFGKGGGGGRPEEIQQIQKFSPQQQQFMNMFLGGTQPGLSSGMEYLTDIIGGGEESFNKFAAPYKRQFEEQTIPALAERFAGLDAQGSSAFGQALGAAGAGLTENLAALKEGLRGQALSQLSGLAGIGLTPQFESVMRPEQPGFLQSLAPGLGAGATSAIPKLIELLMQKFGTSGAAAQTP